MSAVFGIFHPDGGSVSPEVLEVMAGAMDYWGPDRSEVWRDGPIALGHLMRRNTPESLKEPLPFRDPGSGLTITAAARIDNREELFEAIGTPHSERAVIPDSVIILKAYQKWGKRCPDHLLGDWAFAIWDARQKKLFLARDHHGVTGLYYYSSPRFFVFATCLKGLLALPDIPRRPNDLAIAQVLLNWCPSGGPTVYQDILRLPPAHAMTVTPEGPTVHRYWRLEDAPALLPASDQEYIEGFLDIYKEAVRCRMRSAGPIGTMLSGGLDSGSVAVLAARELRKKGERLPAFSSVPLNPLEAPDADGYFRDETPYIEATSRYSGNIDTTYVRAENLSPLAGIRRALDLADHPLTGGVNEYWLLALLETARVRGIRVILTGQEGNNTVSWSGRGYLAALARKGRWPLLWRELKAWSSLHDVPLWRAAAGQAVKPQIPFGLRRRLISASVYATILNPETVRRLDIIGRMFETGHDPEFWPKPDTRLERFAFIKPGKAWHAACAQAYGAGFDLEMRDPTADKRVMEYCLALPDHLFFQDGVGRLLIRRAMKGLLPPEVLWNPRRGLQAADLDRRLQDNQAELFAVYEQFKKSESIKNYLNIKIFDDILSTLRYHTIGNTGGSDKLLLLSGFMMGLFLMRFDGPGGGRR